MLDIRPEISNALSTPTLGGAVVALETAVLTHGLPYPQNLQIVNKMQNAVAQQGAIPAVVGVINGNLIVGLSNDELEHLANPQTISEKLSSRDLAWAYATQKNGGTTVAATLVACRLAQIRTFATGGIGGVHRNWPASRDISADLDELAKTPTAVLCSGAKSILDLPATLESLESKTIPTLALNTDKFPQFYSNGSPDLPAPRRINTINEAALLCKSHWCELNINTSVIIANPLPEQSAVPHHQIENIIKKAITQAQQNNITGRALTPFLLKRIAELTQGKSMKANLALLESNAAKAGELALQLARQSQ